MALTHFGFIVTGSGLEPAHHRTTLESPSFRMEVVGITRASEAPAVAKAMVARGVQLIELCGGFGPVGTAAVLEAIGHAVPVGSVAYGPESIDAMHALFA